RTAPAETLALAIALADADACDTPGRGRRRRLVAGCGRDVRADAGSPQRRLRAFPRDLRGRADRRLDQPRTGWPGRVRSGDAGRLPRDRQHTACRADSRFAGDLPHHLLPDAARRGDRAGAAARGTKPAPARTVVAVVRGIAAALLRRIDAGVRRGAAVFRRDQGAARAHGDPAQHAAAVGAGSVAPAGKRHRYAAADPRARVAAPARRGVLAD